MRTVDATHLAHITSAYSRREHRRHLRVSQSLERALAASSRAFAVFRVSGSDNRPTHSTMGLAVLEPDRLESCLPELEALARMWEAHARTAATRGRARAADRAATALRNAITEAKTWLQEADTLLAEQARLGMLCRRVLPESDRERATLLHREPQTRMSEADRRDLLRALRDAARHEGGIVSAEVFNRLCDLADRGDAQAQAALATLRRSLGLDLCA